MHDVRHFSNMCILQAPEWDTTAQAIVLQLLTGDRICRRSNFAVSPNLHVTYAASIVMPWSCCVPGKFAILAEI